MRWRPQIRIRTLLVLILMLAFGTAWVGERRRALAHRRQAIAAIVELGGGVQFDYQSVPGAVSPGPYALKWMLGDDDAFARVELVSFYDGQSRIGGGALAILNKLKELRELHLEDSTISDAELVHLKGLVGLEVLSISKMQLTQERLECLRSLRSLRRLIVSRELPPRVVEQLTACLPSKCEVARE